MSFSISQDFVAEANARSAGALAEDYAHLGRVLARRGVAIDEIAARVAAFGVALPSWGVGTGGTRFARFPGVGEPRHIFDKLDDCAVVKQLTRATPTISLHFPWDRFDDPRELREAAAARGLEFDAVNSNTFQDQPGQKHSYKFGSLSNADAGARAQAVEHNLECIALGDKLGSKALTVWIGDGSNFAGQSNLTKAFDRYLDSMHKVYAGLPADWQVFLEHKLYEPAFYSTVISDWGSQLCRRARAGSEGQMPGRSRPSRAERQHRADRRAAGAARQARGLPFQRQQVWRRRSRRRLDLAVPALPGVQRTRRRRRARARRASRPPICSTSRTMSAIPSRA